jgi:hypothetical protein
MNLLIEVSLEIKSAMRCSGGSCTFWKGYCGGSAGLAPSDIGNKDINAKRPAITSLDERAGMCSIASLRGMFDLKR